VKSTVVGSNLAREEEVPSPKDHCRNKAPSFVWQPIANIILSGGKLIPLKSEIRLSSLLLNAVFKFLARAIKQKKERKGI
jgi:hypothetical protein